MLAIVRDSGYRADPLARRLATGRSQVLGVFTYERVFLVSRRTFYHPFLLGVEEGAEATGHDLLLLTSAATSGPVRSIYAGGENKLRLVDAAVLIGRDEIPAELEELISEDYPFVFVGRRYLPDGSEVPNVAPDYAGASAALAERLYGSGHRRVAYVGSNPDLPATADRLAGLRGGHLDVDAHPLSVTKVDDSLIGRFRRAGITAVVTENTAYGEAVADAAERSGLIVPDGLSVAVAGVSEDVDSDAGWSGFRIPGRAIGRLAVDELLARLDGDAARTRLVDCTPQHGETLAAVPVPPRGRARTAPSHAEGER